eukprot:s1445_g6.t1
MPDLTTAQQLLGNGSLEKDATEKDQTLSRHSRHEAYQNQEHQERDVRPLRGGFKAWQAQGLPVQKVPYPTSD